MGKIVQNTTCMRCSQKKFTISDENPVKCNNGNSSTVEKTNVWMQSKRMPERDRCLPFWWPSLMRVWWVFVWCSLVRTHVVTESDRKTRVYLYLGWHHCYAVIRVKNSQRKQAIIALKKQTIHLKIEQWEVRCFKHIVFIGMVWESCEEMLHFLHRKLCKGAFKVGGLRSSFVW